MATYNDDEIFVLLMQNLKQELSKFGHSEVLVLSKNQPTQQGAHKTIERAIYFEELFDNRYGSPKEEVKKNMAGEVIETVSQITEKTIQISAFATQNPKTPSGQRLTALDLAHIAAGIFNRPEFCRKLNKLGVGILRASNVRNLAFQNDQDRLEQTPSFDLKISFTREMKTPSNALNGFGVNLFPI